MEMQSQSSKPDPIRPKDNKLLSLDDYHSFVDSNKQIHLALKKLTQVSLSLSFMNSTSFGWSRLIWMSFKLLIVDFDV